MATNQINMNELLRDPYKAYGYWADKKYGDNTANLTDEQYGQLCEKWNDYQAKWDRWAQSVYSSDSNGWYIDPDDFEHFFEEGYNSMQESTGYERTSGQSAQQTGTNIAYITTGAVSGVETAFGVSSSITGKAVNAAQSTFDNALDKMVNQGLDATSETINNFNQASADLNAAQETADMVKEGSLLVRCALAAATGAAVFLQKPNEEEAKALETATNKFAQTKNTLESEQSSMKQTGEDVEKTGEEAEKVNQKYQDEITQKTADLKMYEHAYNQIKAKIDSGVNLTDTEKAMYKNAVKNMNLLSADIEGLEKDSQEDLFNIQSEMTSKMDIFDATQEKIANAQGQTEYVASFDKATRNSAIATAVGDALNVCSGGKAAYDAIAFGKSLITGGATTALFGGWVAWAAGAVYIAAGVAGGAGAVASGYDLTKQLGYITTAATAIDTREIIEKATETTQVAMDDGINDIIKQVQEVDEIEIELPDIENIPTTADIPEQSAESDEQRRNNPFLT